MRKLIWDSEVTPNVMYSWRTGYNLSLDYNMIVDERAIICICYKWAGSEKVHSLHWDKGDDREMLRRFTKVLASADIAVAHNGDKFDVKWFRTRCIYHRIECPDNIVTHDTLKSARGRFLFNSNRLDYIAKFLGLGQKEDTGGLKLWKDVMAGNRAALRKMIDYCKNDVIILEKVEEEMNKYIPAKVHAGVLAGGFRHSCPKCGSGRTKRNKRSVSASGMHKVQLVCNDCGSNWTMAESSYAAELKKERKSKAFAQ